MPLHTAPIAFVFSEVRGVGHREHGVRVLVGTPRGDREVAETASITRSPGPKGVQAAIRVRMGTTWLLSASINWRFFLN